MIFQQQKFSWVIPQLLISSLLIICTSVSVSANTSDRGNEDDVDTITEEVVDESFTLEDLLSKIPEIINQVETIIASINEGDYEGAILGTLGVIGLIDPQQEANNVATSSLSIFNEIESVEDLITMSEASDVQASQVNQHIPRIIFSEEGQEVIAEQNEIIEITQEASLMSQEATAEVHLLSESIAVENTNHADFIGQQADEAQAAKASQDVLKAIAAQQEYRAQIDAGLSDQLSLLGEAQVYNSIQLRNVNTQLTILNQRKQNSATFLATQINQLAEIDSNLEEQIKTEKRQENQALNRSRFGLTKIYIPGLYSSEEED